MPWWITTDFSDAHFWSKEELRAYRAIWGLFIPFVAMFMLSFIALFKAIGVERHIADFIGISGFPVAVYVARQTCKFMWPQLMQKADEKAKARIQRR